MIVDDDPDLRRLISLVLQMGGYEVVLAENGLEALSKVRLERPDLILLDIMMPEIDGFETCRRLRKLPEGATIPVIMLSAADQVADKVRGLQVGANDYITKPADSRELIARIEAHLRPAHARPAFIAAVLGSKSGVGTTTMAINLAFALKQLADEEVVLLDWHLPLGDVGTFLNVQVRHALDDLSSNISNLDEQMVEQIMVRHSSGLRILQAGRHLDETPLTPQSLESVLDVLSRMAAYIVIDAGEATDPAWLQPLEVADQVFLIVTPELPSLRRAALCLEWERSHPLFGERLQLVINRSGARGGIPVSDIQRLLGMSARVHLPEAADDVVESINQGTPLVVAKPRSGYASVIQTLARELHNLTQQAVAAS
ncbi:MAG: response regulator [Anaerolineae bacterium]